MLIFFSILTGLPNLADISAGYSQWHVLRVVYCVGYRRYDVYHVMG